MLGKERSGDLKFVCSDMWKPYLKVIAKKASQAIHVLDRFHIMQKMNQAIDTYEAIETALYHNLGALPEPEFTHKFW